jgi:2-polyprenyl-3-methyl-5-hydroxy-6-metoxy-1,4-benzoquinol methylase
VELSISRGGLFLPEETLYQIRLVDVINSWNRDFGIDVSSYFEGHDHIEVRFDPETALVTFEPAPTGDEELYAALSTRDWYYLEGKWEHLSCLAHLRTKSEVLEVGSGRGGFLHLLRQDGHDGLGVELNSDGARKARERGLLVETIDLFQAPMSWQGRFDAAAAFQVVEHVPDPLAFCRKLFDLVKPGGFLFIAVPNRRCFARTYERTNILDMPPHHITRWDDVALKRLGRRLGAARTRILYSPLEAVHVDWFIESLRHGHLGRFLLSRSRPRRVASWALSAGLRKLLRGHSIAARFDKAAANASVAG